MPDCELCCLVAGDAKTRLYYRNKTCTIVDCIDCKVPMAVLNYHGPADVRDERIMENSIHYLFPDATIRKEMRKIKSHLHWHIIGGKYLGS